MLKLNKITPQLWLAPLLICILACSNSTCEHDSSTNLTSSNADLQNMERSSAEDLCDHMCSNVLPWSRACTYGEATYMLSGDYNSASCYDQCIQIHENPTPCFITRADFQDITDYPSCDAAHELYFANIKLLRCTDSYRAEAPNRAIQTIADNDMINLCADVCGRASPWSITCEQDAVASTFEGPTPDGCFAQCLSLRSAEPECQATVAQLIRANTAPLTCEELSLVLDAEEALAPCLTAPAP